MTTVIILIIGMLLGGLGGAVTGFVLGVDYERRKDNAPVPDVLNGEER